MEILSIILLILISTFVAIIMGHLDAMVILRNQLSNINENLNHTTRVTMRSALFFFLALLAYMNFPEHERNFGTLILLWLICDFAFFTPFNLTLNKRRYMPWNYLGKTSFTDRTLKKIGGMITGIVLSYGLMIICIWILL